MKNIDFTDFFNVFLSGATITGAPFFALTVLTKATPGYAGGEKELIARGGVDKKKSPS